MISIGLAEIKVGTAAADGNMPSSLAKIGKVYRDTGKMSQEAAEVTEHFEEGRSAPEYRKKTRKIPKIAFSLMDVDASAMAKYIGGKESGGEWSYDGNEVVENVAMQIIPEQGLVFDIPNADVEAVINADMSAKGIFLVDFTVTPMAVSAGGAIRARKKV